MTEQQRKQREEFIKELAEYLAGKDTAEYSIGLQLGNRNALQWKRLRELTPLFGYPSQEEAVRTLTEFFAQG